MRSRGRRPGAGLLPRRWQECQLWPSARCPAPQVLPNVQIRRFDALLRKSRADVGAVLRAVVDRLREEDRDRNLVLLTAALDPYDLVRGQAPGEGDQFLPAGARMSLQLGDSGEVAFFQHIGRLGAPAHGCKIASFGGEEVNEAIADRSVGAGSTGIEPLVGEVFAGVEQAQVRPEVVLVEVDENFTHRHSYRFASSYSSTSSPITCSSRPPLMPSTTQV